MNKTTRTELCRLFLLENLPDPLTRADRHLQFFDNYIANTRMRLRTLRVPETKEWTWILQQRIVAPNNRAQIEIAEIFLNEAEYHTFEKFEGREIRKNRYFWETDGREVEIDVFLGNLWGLNMARVCFETPAEMEKFTFPLDALEVTDDKFFYGDYLVGKNFTDVQTRVAEIVAR